MDIRQGGLGDPQVEALLHRHRAESHASTPARNAHSLDSAALAAAEVSFFSAWDGDALLGIGAIKQLSADHAELKSMRTAPAHLRRGVARAMLGHLIALARARGYRRVSLETGTAPMFEPANRMYEAAGFVDCPPFGGYPASPHNRFMTLDLEIPCPPSS
jgi:putative acetyltransferase